MEKNILKIATELNLKPDQVQRVVELLSEGSTIPFIARYRKEVTESLDEVVLASIRDRHEQLIELDKRKEAVLKSIEKQEKLTPALAKAIDEAETLNELEDIYLPYKPKRKTRASMAREKGLEPLARTVFEQGKIDVSKTAAGFIDVEKGVTTEQEALEGARDIMA
jgi:protein Tex